MEYIFLIIVVICVSLQNILKKHYATKTEKQNTFLFAFFTVFAAMLFFVVQSGFKLEFNPAILPYCVGFAVSFCATMFGAFLAIKYGPLSITLLLTSYSLIIPTFHGVFVLNDSISLVGIIGFALLLISLFFINIKKGEETEKKFSLKWFIYLLMSFFGNGFCSLIQKLQQLKFDGDYKSEFMILALLMCCVFFIGATVICKEKIKVGLKYCLPLGIFGGVANGVVNYLVMVLSNILPSAILYPSISAGGIVIGFVVALFVYKEKLTKTQFLGYLIGTVSVALLNL